MKKLPKLHQSTISGVREKLDIHEIVSAHVALKKSGKSFVGLCPFHDDKRHPSFNVSQDKGVYHCFGCGAGGDAINFLMQIGRRQFSEVVLDLASKYNVPIETAEPEQIETLKQQLSETELMYEVLALACKFYQYTLTQPQGRDALTYLIHDRALHHETIQQFQIGCAPKGWDTLLKFLTEKKNYPIAILEKAGLVKKRDDGGYYDRFRDRVMIPIMDEQGRVIGFGGRSLGSEMPKYLNSPQTDLFDKGGTLYGLDRAKSAIIKRDCAIVVEGYFDVIALHTAGITNAVASLGTALSQHQVKMLMRFTESKKIILNFDADKAGQKATDRAIGEVSTLAYQDVVKLHVLNIPDGKDADEFLKANSKKAYEKLLKTAPNWIDWQVQKVLDQSEGLAETTEKLAQLLSSIVNASARMDYIKHCAERLSEGKSWRVRQLEEDLRLQVKGRRSFNKGSVQKEPRSLLEESEAQLLRLYLHLPEQRDSIKQSMRDRDLEFTCKPHRLIWRLIADAVDPLATLREAMDQENSRQIYCLLELDDRATQEINRPDLCQRSALAGMERVLREKRQQNFTQLWKGVDLMVNPSLAQYYQQKIYAEAHEIRLLDSQRSAIEFSSKILLT